MTAVDLLWALLVGLVVGVVYLNVRRGRLHDRRGRRLGSIAHRHGWLYSDGDVFGLGAYDFGLFRQGDARGFENTIWGDHKGTPFQFADYWYATEHDSEELAVSFQRARRRMSVTIVRFHAYLPKLRVDPEGFSKWLVDPTDTLDVHFESEEFNRRFSTEASDRSFAYKLIVPSMMQWLLAMPAGFGVEFYKSSLVVFAPQVDPSHAFAMVACAVGIRERIPRLVWDEYEVPPADAERYWA